MSTSGKVATILGFKASVASRIWNHENDALKNVVIEHSCIHQLEFSQDISIISNCRGMKHAGGWN